SAFPSAGCLLVCLLRLNKSPLSKAGLPPRSKISVAHALMRAAPRLPRKSSRSSCGLQGNLVSLGLQFAHPPNFHPPLCAAAHAHSSRRLCLDGSIGQQAPREVLV